MSKDDDKRYTKGFAVALAIHLVAGFGLGAFAFTSLATKQQAIELTLAPAGQKAKAAARSPKPKPIVRPPREDDIADKRLKPLPKPAEEMEESQETDVDGSAVSNAPAANEGESGHGQGDGNGDAGVPVQHPYVLYSVKPSYPSDARARKSTGTVHLKVLVEANGRASEVAVTGSSGDSSLDNAAVNSLYKWKFSPARNNKGEAIRCYVAIPVTFVLN